MNSLTTQNTVQIEERFYYLDAARAFALIIGIFFHGVIFMVSYMTPLTWAVKNNQSNLGIDIFFFLSHSFRMQAFFMIAGFFAHMVYHKKGANGFIKHRTKRITLPLLIFWPVIFLLISMLWIWGYQRMGYLSLNPSTASLSYWQIVAGNFISGRWLNGGFPLTHLWFLYLLTWFFISVLIIRYLFDYLIDRNNKIRISLDKYIALLMSHWWGSLFFALLTVPAMWRMKNNFGVEAPDHGLLPNAASFLVFGIYFSLGWFLHRGPQLMESFKKYWKSNLTICLFFLGTICTFFIYRIKRPDFQAGITDPTILKFISIFFNSFYGLASMTAVFAFIGIMMTLFAKQSKLITYLSQSSYWLYLIHLPIIMFFQILVFQLPVHWTVKLLLVFVPSFIIMISSYHFLVRKTKMGVLLNGKKYQ
jgi:glucans biosynthesis protein C